MRERLYLEDCVADAVVPIFASGLSAALAILSGHWRIAPLAALPPLPFLVVVLARLREFQKTDPPMAEPSLSATVSPR